MSFSFGGTSVAQPAAPSSTGFSFGAAAPTTSSGFSFGSATTPAPANGGGFAFGSSTGSASPSTGAAPATSSGFNFGGAPSTGATSTAARSLFGGASPGAPAATTTPASGFSFGAAPGATAATTAAPASGFSFGAAPSSAAPATGGSSLFGGSTAAPATGSGFSFGGNSSTATAPSAGSGFFGAGKTAAAAAPATSGTSGFSFGASPTTSAFGTNSALAPAGTTPGSSFGFFGGGGAAATPQQNGQGITLETAFEALPADVKKNIVEFHQVLREADQADALLRTVSPRQLAALNANIERLGQDVLARRNVQDRQATAVHHARKDTKHLIRQVDAAALSMRTLDGHSASSVYHHVLRHAETPSPYYWELLDHFELQMQAVKAQIEDIEAEYKPLHERRALSGTMAGTSPALLQQIMMQQNAALMQVAARVAEVHERAEDARQLFLVKMQQDLARHGEHNPAAFRNPFEKRKQSAHGDKRETIDKIRFRTSVAPTIVAATPAQPTAASGFGGFGAPAAATSAAPSMFGSTPGTTSAFGSTAGAGAAPTAAGGSSLFGSTAPAAAAPAATTTTGAGSGGFSFGGSTAAATAPKQVSFNLGPTAAPAAAPSSTTTSAFSVPSVATSGSAFGGVSSSFLTGAAPGEAEKRAANSKRLGGRAKKRA